MEWLMGVDKNDPTKGLEVLVFHEQAFHMREKVKGIDRHRVLQRGPAEQLEFLKGLRAKMMTDGKRRKKTEYAGVRIFRVRFEIWKSDRAGVEKCRLG
jgi:hypothetical protein